MTTVYNSDLIKELIDAVKIQTSHDAVPNRIAEKIVPTVETNPKLFKVNTVCEAGQKATTGNLSLYVTPSDKRFFITGFTMSYIKDGSSDNTSVKMNVNVPDEGYRDLFEFAGITLTASSGNISVQLAKPLELIKNSAITLTGAFTVGVLNRTACIYGYTENLVEA